MIRARADDRGQDFRCRARPGYPLLTVTAHFFGLVPIGSYALRMSLYAATCSSVCVGVVYSTVRRLTPQRASAVGAGVGLALTPVFWQSSVVFEVFALANLLAATLAYLLVRWYQRPAARVSSSEPRSHSGWL